LPTQAPGKKGVNPDHANTLAAKLPASNISARYSPCRGEEGGGRERKRWKREGKAALRMAYSVALEGRRGEVGVEERGGRFLRGMTPMMAVRARGRRKARARAREVRPGVVLLGFVAGGMMMRGRRGGRGARKRRDGAKDLWVGFGAKGGGVKGEKDESMVVRVGCGCAAEGGCRGWGRYTDDDDDAVFADCLNSQ
jgi:hypothetical protein